MISKKDFKVIADTFVSLRIADRTEKQSLADCERWLKIAMQSINPRFSNDKWNSYIQKGLEKYAERVIENAEAREKAIKDGSICYHQH